MRDDATGLLALGLAAVLASTFGCGRITIPPQLLDCRTLGCPTGEVCTPPSPTPELATRLNAGALYRCEAAPEPPAPTPEPEPTPSPSPTPTPACVLTGVPTVAAIGHRNTLGEAVNAVMRELSGYGGGRVVVEMGRQEWQAKVEAALRSKGICAGQHTPTTDEIAVARVASDSWEGFHIYADNPSRPGTGTVVWSVGEVEQKGSSYRGAWYPPGTAPAEPIEPACPAPRWESFRTSGDAASCGFVWGLEPRARWRDKAGDVVRGWDATLKVTRCCGFCEAIGLGTFGGAIRCECPLRAEGNPERIPCEAEVGAIWQTDGVAVVNPDNPAQATCSSCSWLRVCTKSGRCSAKVAP